jgi:DeoR family transcriptional regulator of aga operon
MGSPPGRRQRRVDDRRARLVQLVRSEGTAGVADLALRLGCSVVTVRRDLAALAKANEGADWKRYHGAVAVRGLVLERGFQEKMAEAEDEKAAIAKAVVALLPEGAVVGMNGGTTAARVAEQLGAESRLVTVVTNAVNLAVQLSNSGIPVIVVGGTLRPMNYETTGPTATATIQSLAVDVAVVAVDGVDDDFAFSAASDVEAEVGWRLSQAAERVVVVADHLKFGRRAPYRMLGWDDVDLVVTGRESIPIVAPWAHALSRRPGEGDPDAVVWEVVHGGEFV